MEEEEAERLKKAYGDAFYEEEEDQEEATCKLDDDSRTIKVSDLNNIVEARAEEIIANVWNQGSAIRLRRQAAGRNHHDRRSCQPEESGRNVAQTQQDRKDQNGETSHVIQSMLQATY